MSARILIVKTKYQALLVLLILSVIVIFVRFTETPVVDINLKQFENKQVLLKGIISGEPDTTISGKKFIVEVLGGEVNGVSVAFPNPSYVLVKSDTFDTRVVYGSEVSVRAKLVKPEVIIGDDGREFNYPKYLAKSKIFYIADRAQVEVLRERQGSWILTHLYEWKHMFMSGVERLLPAPHSFLANGLVISGKGSMSKELQLEFQKVGLIHIVVLSGSNISIIGEAIVRSLSFLPMLWSSVLGGIGIVIFSCMTGGGATVVRSAIMAVIALIARVTKRQNDALVSLALAGSCMLIQNPLLLSHDPSFQLSFTASLGLILYSPRVLSVIQEVSVLLQKVSYVYAGLLKKIPEAHKNFLLEITSSSCATQIATFPLILHMSGMVSVVSLPVNILLLPLIPYTMLSVFAVGVTSFIVPGVAKLFAHVSWILLSVILTVVHEISSLDFSVIQLPPISNNVILVLYTLMTVEFMIFSKRKGMLQSEKHA